MSGLAPDEIAPGVYVTTAAMYTTTTTIVSKAPVITTVPAGIGTSSRASWSGR